ncbi:GNAT family N-acetyltransferase [Chromobacterium sp. IIBBL 290-4]|uniref:GNAT family N-acetyltransferase n=1 Tax=Chromobacterium sp. IIBBL 290-4 TaxID=2953890 RepID=UPI0020B873C1|nr:GNAT family N-acetyltransferase [Chromobacterium sp. IIBBL 290-4]UTH72972.1 GNAT family N-acetyltransferase [Chromobacterium sp. IIBBL 290-4]
MSIIIEPAADMRRVVLEPASIRQWREWLAAGEASALGLRSAVGALPPAEVLLRGFEQMDQGGDAAWCLPYCMALADCVVGSCGFKGEPCLGIVEIGYGVAPAWQGRGIAKGAVLALLDIARDSGRVRMVLAQVNPQNQPSTRLVRSLGFEAGEILLDERDGEPLRQWLWPVEG